MKIRENEFGIDTGSPHVVGGLATYAGDVTMQRGRGSPGYGMDKLPHVSAECFTAAQHFMVTHRHCPSLPDSAQGWAL